jgi:hypothetical protein
MIVLDVKMARHDVVPVFVSEDGLRKYNFGIMPATTEGKVLYTIEEVDVTKVDFKFETMVSRLKALRAYILS